MLKSIIIALLIIASVSPSYLFNIDEDVAVNTLVGFMELNANNFIQDSTYFRLDGKKLLVNRLLDRDLDRKLCPDNSWPRKCIYTGLIGGNPDLIKFKVIINDVNDNTPSWAVEFGGEPEVYDEMTKLKIQNLTIEISENVKVGQVRDLFLASDPDLGENSIQDYYLYKSDHDYFSIKTYHGPNGIVPQIFVNREIDYETRKEFEIIISARDGGGRQGLARIKIRIIDENDNHPEFINSMQNETFIIDVNEDERVGSRLKNHPIAKDKDSGVMGRIKYRLPLSTNKQTRNDFSIDSATGDIVVTNQLDYDTESRKTYSFVLIAEDGGSPPKSAEQRVMIRIHDTNDNHPKIELINDDLKVLEGSAGERLIAAITVKDLDSGLNGEFTCRLLIQDSLELIQKSTIERLTIFHLVSRSSYDREEQSVIRNTMICRDHGTPSLETNQLIEIRVDDVDDNPPRFKKRNFIFEFPEGNDANAEIGNLEATDRDVEENAEIDYEITDPTDTMINIFSVNKQGKLLARLSLDRELKPEGYNFTVIARGRKNPSFMDTANVEVYLVDINDCVPEFSRKTYEFSVEEHDYSIANEKRIGQVKATDCDIDEFGRVDYKIHDASVPFRVDNEGIIYATGPIDRESISFYSFKVIAFDDPKSNGGPDYKTQQGSPKRGMSQVNVEVSDVNDNAPKFINLPNRYDGKLPKFEEFKLSYREPKGYFITNITAIDSDMGNNARLVYKLSDSSLNSHLELNETTGRLTLAKELTFDQVGSSKVQIAVSDNGQPVRTSYAEIVLTITDTPQKTFLKKGTNNAEVFFLQRILSENLLDMTREKSIFVIIIISLFFAITLFMIVFLMMKIRICCSRNPPSMIHGQAGNQRSSSQTGDKDYKPFDNFYFAGCEKLEPLGYCGNMTNEGKAQFSYLPTSGTMRSFPSTANEFYNPQMSQNCYNSSTQNNYPPASNEFYNGNIGSPNTERKKPLSECNRTTLKGEKCCVKPEYNSQIYFPIIPGRLCDEFIPESDVDSGRGGSLNNPGLMNYCF